jgi:hypothetical protein
LAAATEDVVEQYLFSGDLWLVSGVGRGVIPVGMVERGDVATDAWLFLKYWCDN